MLSLLVACTNTPLFFNQKLNINIIFFILLFDTIINIIVFLFCFYFVIQVHSWGWKELGSLDRPFVVCSVGGSPGLHCVFPLSPQAQLKMRFSMSWTWKQSCNHCQGCQGRIYSRPRNVNSTCTTEGLDSSNSMGDKVLVLRPSLSLKRQGLFVVTRWVGDVDYEVVWLVNEVSWSDAYLMARVGAAGLLNW